MIACYLSFTPSSLKLVVVMVMVVVDGREVHKPRAGLQLRVTTFAAFPTKSALQGLRLP